ncbi:MAG: hypothetical protein PVF68_06045 [Acidobacteriota bacterium]
MALYSAHRYLGFLPTPNHHEGEERHDPWASGAIPSRSASRRGSTGYPDGLFRKVSAERMIQDRDPAPARRGWNVIHTALEASEIDGRIRLGWAEGEYRIRRIAARAVPLE